MTTRTLHAPPCSTSLKAARGPASSAAYSAIAVFAVRLVGGWVEVRDDRWD